MGKIKTFYSTPLKEINIGKNTTRSAGLKCRSQVTGHRPGYRSGQVTGHTQKQYDTRENCSGLTFYYTKIK